MATRATWTVIMDDRSIIKQVGDAAGTKYQIDDNVFWSQSAYNNIWAIQYGTIPSSDEVEYRDTTPHSTWASTGLSFQTFIDKWDVAHLARLQSNWDDNNVTNETSSEKISRLGVRPTSYSS